MNVKRIIPRTGQGRIRIRIGLTMTFVGFALFILGAEPSLLGIDGYGPTGFLQISVFTFALAIICVGGYLTLNGLWNTRIKSILADIGLRLVSTGYVIAFASALSDMFGFGNVTRPLVPYFGPWQVRGVIIGEIVIAIGFLLMIPYRKPDLADDQAQK